MNCLISVYCFPLSDVSVTSAVNPVRYKLWNSRKIIIVRQNFLILRRVDKLMRALELNTSSPPLLTRCCEWDVCFYFFLLLHNIPRTYLQNVVSMCTQEFVHVFVLKSNFICMNYNIFKQTNIHSNVPNKHIS